MVCIEIANRLRHDLLCKINLDLALYNYCNDKKVIVLPDGKNVATNIAYKGYNKETDNTFNIDLIDSHETQNNFSDKFTQCIGVRLYTCADEATIYSDFEKFDIKQKYIMTKIFDFLKKPFIKILESENNITSNFLSVIMELDHEKTQREIEYEYMLEPHLDIIDLIILEDYIKKYGMCAYVKTDSKELIISVLNNFSNSIKWITLNRRSGKPHFEFKDEYDVQDILCLIIQSIYSDCEKEDPTTKDPQGLYHRIDLVIHSLGIFIEIKMIKKKTDVKTIKTQIDEDIVGYSTNKDLKHLIFFTYDPNRYADNENYFKGFQKDVKYNGVSFTVDKIYQK